MGTVATKPQLGEVALERQCSPRVSVAKRHNPERVAAKTFVFVRLGVRPPLRAVHGPRGYDSMTDDPSTPVDEAHMFEPRFDRHVSDLNATIALAGTHMWGAGPLRLVGTVLAADRSLAVVASAAARFQ